MLFSTDVLEEEAVKTYIIRVNSSKRKTVIGPSVPQTCQDAAPGGTPRGVARRRDCLRRACCTPQVILSKGQGKDRICLLKKGRCKITGKNTTVLDLPRHNSHWAGKWAYPFFMFALTISFTCSAGIDTMSG